MNGPLPEGWAIVPLDRLLMPGGLFDGPFGSNLKTSDYVDAGVRVVRLENLGHLHFDASKRTFISHRKYEALTKHTVGQGDIIFGSFVGDDVRVCVLPALDTPAIAKADCFCVRSDERLADRRVLAYYLASPIAREYLIDRIHGATRPRINTTQLREVSVLLPPREEQSRFVERIEALLAKVRSSKQRLDNIPTILKRFRQAVLSAAGSGTLTADWREQNATVERPAISVDDTANVALPESWGWTHSSEVFDVVTSGSRGWAKYYSNAGAMFIRVGNLDHDTIKLDMSDLQRVAPPAGAEGLRTRVRNGDILISITADVGMVSLVDHNIEEAYINQHVALARPNSRLNPKYLAYFLASQIGQRQFFELQRGATKVGLGLDDIRGVWIAHPPAPEQREIVKRIEGMLALADRLDGRHKKAKAHVDKLSQSVLAKAFRGELVPTEAELARQEKRDYEPASVLLERIRSEQKDVATKTWRKQR